MTEQHDLRRVDGATLAVVVVGYNQAHFLGDALASVLAQTRPADEIVLIDDGSTDDTAAVAARFGEARYLWQQNAGLSAARNAGLAAIGSRYVLFLDSDDVLAPQTLANALPALRADPRLAFVYGGYREVAADLAELAVHPPIVRDDPFAGLLQRGNYISMHGTVLYDAERLRGCGGFDPSLKSCEDYDVFLRLVRDHPIAAYDSIAADYRRHGQSLSRNALRMIATSHAVLDRHARTPAERALARQGKAIMTSYYGDMFWWTVAGNLRRRRFSDAIESLRQVLPARHLWGPLARRAVRFVAARGREWIRRRRA